MSDMPPERPSALDMIAQELPDGESWTSAVYAEARAELSALRERVADLEAMLLGVRERRFDIWEDEDRATVGRMDADEWQVECEIRAFDPTGLPVLTDEARAKLRGEGKR